jgi:undecaprenyl-diphosphatase
MMKPVRATLRWIGRHIGGFYAAVGVFLVLGLSVSLTALLIFGALALLVANGLTQQVDEAVLLWMYDRANPWLDSWASKLTALGSTVVVVMVVLVATLFLWISRHRWSVALLWTAMLGSAVLSKSLKSMFDRPRPELWERMHAGDASFPSGHAMSAVVIYGTLAYLVARLEKDRTVRRLTLGVAGMVIVLIGLTRLYLGVHYPSDVLAGYVAALSWASFCALGIEAVRYFRHRAWDAAAGERDLERGMDPVRDALRGDR